MSSRASVGGEIFQVGLARTGETPLFHGQDYPNTWINNP
jgi:hypothetical protein